MEDIIQAIAKKHKAEYGVASTIFSFGDGEAALVTISIPIGMKAYVLELGGYTNQQNILMEYRDKHNNIIYDWEEYPDTFFTVKHIPFADSQNLHDDSFNIKFENSSGEIALILVMVTVLLMSKNSIKAFEEDLEDLANLPKNIKNIANALITQLSVLRKQTAIK